MAYHNFHIYHSMNQRCFDDANHVPALPASDSLAYQDNYDRWLPHLQAGQAQGLVPLLFN